MRCRGEANRLSFALQLCVVRHYGRFLDDYAGVSARILNFLSPQLHLPPILAVEPSSREGTHQEHQRRIREYLGLQTFDLATQQRIERWVCGQAAEGLSPAEIFPHAEETLRLWDVIGPWGAMEQWMQLRFIVRGIGHRAATIWASSTATLFVLFSAATGTGVVSTRFGCLQPDCLPA
jgi:uncharacterized protein DUF4158